MSIPTDVKATVTYLIPKLLSSLAQVFPRNELYTWVTKQRFCDLVINKHNHVVIQMLCYYLHCPWRYRVLKVVGHRSAWWYFRCI